MFQRLERYKKSLEQYKAAKGLLTEDSDKEQEQQQQQVNQQHQPFRMMETNANKKQQQQSSNSLIGQFQLEVNEMKNEIEQEDDRNAMDDGFLPPPINEVQINGGGGTSNSTIAFHRSSGEDIRQGLYEEHMIRRNKAVSPTDQKFQDAIDKLQYYQYQQQNARESELHNAVQQQQQKQQTLHPLAVNTSPSHLQHHRMNVIRRDNPYLESQYYYPHTRGASAPLRGASPKLSSSSIFDQTTTTSSTENIIEARKLYTTSTNNNASVISRAINSEGLPPIDPVEILRKCGGEDVSTSSISSSEPVSNKQRTIRERLDQKDFIESARSVSVNASDKEHLGKINIPSASSPSSLRRGISVTDSYDIRPGRAKPDLLKRHQDQQQRFSSNLYSGSLTSPKKNVRNSYFAASSSIVYDGGVRRWKDDPDGDTSRTSDHVDYSSVATGVSSNPSKIVSPQIIDASTVNCVGPTIKESNSVLTSSPPQHIIVVGRDVHFANDDQLQEFFHNSDNDVNRPYRRSTNQRRDTAVAADTKSSGYYLNDAKKLTGDVEVDTVVTQILKLHPSKAVKLKKFLENVEQKSKSSTSNTSITTKDDRSNVISLHPAQIQQLEKLSKQTVCPTVQSLVTDDTQVLNPQMHPKWKQKYLLPGEITYPNIVIEGVSVDECEQGSVIVKVMSMVSKSDHYNDKISKSTSVFDNSVSHLTTDHKMDDSVDTNDGSGTYNAPIILHDILSQASSSVYPDRHVPPSIHDAAHTSTTNIITKDVVTDVKHHNAGIEALANVNKDNSRMLLLSSENMNVHTNQPQPSRVEGPATQPMASNVMRMEQKIVDELVIESPKHHQRGANFPNSEIVVDEELSCSGEAVKTPLSMEQSPNIRMKQDKTENNIKSACNKSEPILSTLPIKSGTKHKPPTPESTVPVKPLVYEDKKNMEQIASLAPAVEMKALAVAEENYQYLLPIVHAHSIIEEARSFQSLVATIKSVDNPENKETGQSKPAYSIDSLIDAKNLSYQRRKIRKQSVLQVVGIPVNMGAISEQSSQEDTNENERSTQIENQDAQTLEEIDDSKIPSFVANVENRRTDESETRDINITQSVEHQTKIRRADSDSCPQSNVNSSATSDASSFETSNTSSNISSNLSNNGSVATMNAEEAKKLVREAIEKSKIRPRKPGSASSLPASSRRQVRAVNIFDQSDMEILVDSLSTAGEAASPDSLLQKQHSGSTSVLSDLQKPAKYERHDHPGEAASPNLFPQKPPSYSNVSVLSDMQKPVRHENRVPRVEAVSPKSFSEKHRLPCSASSVLSNFQKSNGQNEATSMNSSAQKQHLSCSTSFLSESQKPRECERKKYKEAESLGTNFLPPKLLLPHSTSVLSDFQKPMKNKKDSRDHQTITSSRTAPIPTRIDGFYSLLGHKNDPPGSGSCASVRDPPDSNSSKNPETPSTKSHASDDCGSHLLATVIEYRDDIVAVADVRSKEEDSECFEVILRDV